MIRSLLSLAALLFTPQLFAQTTYNYAGPTFDTVVAPYTTTNNITGSFTVAQPLAANLAGADIRGDITAMSFTDGQATRTLADTNLCSFRVFTDAAGLITGHEIFLRQSNTTGMQNQHNIELYDPSKGQTDQGGFGALGGTDCAGVALNPFANSSDGTGTWTSAVTGNGQTSIPLNAGWAMLALFALLMWTAYRRISQ